MQTSIDNASPKDFSFSQMERQTPVELKYFRPISEILGFDNFSDEEVEHLVVQLETTLREDNPTLQKKIEEGLDVKSVFSATRPFHEFTEKIFRPYFKEKVDDKLIAELLEQVPDPEQAVQDGDPAAIAIINEYNNVLRTQAIDMMYKLYSHILKTANSRAAITELT